MKKTQNPCAEMMSIMKDVYELRKDRKIKVEFHYSLSVVTIKMMLEREEKITNV